MQAWQAQRKGREEWVRGLLMRAVLVRVGIGHGCGDWHGPYNPRNNEFVYVTIPEDKHKNVPGMERPYSSLWPRRWPGSASATIAMWHCHSTCRAGACTWILTLSI